MIIFVGFLQQKVVIKVSFSGEKKSRTKVMQAAVGVPGNTCSFNLLVQLYCADHLV